MKKALTLIELIFTIIIIGITFTVIPKIIIVSNKTLETTLKEEVVFNMMAKMIDLSFKEYDKENVEYDDILIAHDPDNNPVNIALDCNSSSGYRIGGFVGSRNCENNISENAVAGTGEECDYIDCYDGYNKKIYGHYRGEYNLSITVGYTDEWNEAVYDEDNNRLVFDFNATSLKGDSDSEKTNIKRVYITVVDTKGNNISSVSYYSANIGHIKIESEAW